MLPELLAANALMQSSPAHAHEAFRDVPVGKFVILKNWRDFQVTRDTAGSGQSDSLKNQISSVWTRCTWQVDSHEHQLSSLFYPLTTMSTRRGRGASQTTGTRGGNSWRVASSRPQGQSTPSNPRSNAAPQSQPEGLPESNLGPRGGWRERDVGAGAGSRGKRGAKTPNLSRMELMASV